MGLVTTARGDKLSMDERVEIERGLVAEFATAKVILPVSKKPLVIQSTGQYDKELGNERCTTMVPLPAWEIRSR